VQFRLFFLLLHPFFGSLNSQLFSHEINLMTVEFPLFHIIRYLAPRPAQSPSPQHLLVVKAFFPSFFLKSLSFCFTIIVGPEYLFWSFYSPAARAPKCLCEVIDFAALRRSPRLLEQPPSCSPFPPLSHLPFLVFFWSPDLYP